MGELQSLATVWSVDTRRELEVLADGHRRTGSKRGGAGRDQMDVERAEQQRGGRAT